MSVVLVTLAPELIVADPGDDPEPINIPRLHIAGTTTPKGPSQ